MYRGILHDSDTNQDLESNDEYSDNDDNYDRRGRDGIR